MSSGSLTDSERFRQANRTVWQEGTWHDLKEYFDNVADDASKKKLRSVAQKKAYLQKMGLHVQQETGYFGRGVHMQLIRSRFQSFFLCE